MRFKNNFFALFELIITIHGAVFVARGTAVTVAVDNIAVSAIAARLADGERNQSVWTVLLFATPREAATGTELSDVAGRIVCAALLPIN